MPRVYHVVDLSSAKLKLPDLPNTSESPSEDESLEDEDIENPEAEHEIHLQPHIRPLSHEKLVSEVNQHMVGSNSQRREKRRNGCV